MNSDFSSQVSEISFTLDLYTLKSRTVWCTAGCSPFECRAFHRLHGNHVQCNGWLEQTARRGLRWDSRHVCSGSSLQNSYRETPRKGLRYQADGIRRSPRLGAMRLTRICHFIWEQVTSNTKLQRNGSYSLIPQTMYIYIAWVQGTCLWIQTIGTLVSHWNLDVLKWKDQQLLEWSTLMGFWWHIWSGYQVYDWGISAPPVQYIQRIA